MTFEESVEYQLEGIEAVSSGGILADCDGCETALIAECTQCCDPDAKVCYCHDEGHFSWQSCDSCGSNLGGDRHDGHGLIPKPGPWVNPLIGAELIHLSMCTDCLCYHANGDVPEDWS